MPLPKPKPKRPIPSVEDFRNKILARQQSFQGGTGGMPREEKSKLKRLQKLEARPEDYRERMMELEDLLSASDGLHLSEMQKSYIMKLLRNMEGTRRSDTPMSKSASRWKRRNEAKELRNRNKKSSVDQFLENDIPF